MLLPWQDPQEKGPRLDTYPHLMVVVKGVDAERATNLEIFRKWVGNWTLKRKKELSGEELEAIRGPER